MNYAREAGTTSRQVGEEIFTRYVLPFEVVSVLLLAALVGAVVIARRDLGGKPEEMRYTSTGATSIGAPGGGAEAATYTSPEQDMS